MKSGSFWISSPWPIRFWCPAAAINGDVLDLLDLAGQRETFVNSLSRGMKQRLCLAKTLVHDPPVLILDEPASGLNPRARVEVKALLEELRRMGKTILISSHILTELADSPVNRNHRARKLLMCGPIEEVYHKIQRNRIVRIKFLENMEAGVSFLRSQPERATCRSRTTTSPSSWPPTTSKAPPYWKACWLPECASARSLRKNRTGGRVYDGDEGGGGVKRGM